MADLTINDGNVPARLVSGTLKSCTPTEIRTLLNVENAADVTDATNVAAAGAPIISSQAGAPSSTPAAVGDINIDTTGDRIYVATDTVSSADWDLVPITGAQIKALYEAEADTNAYDDAAAAKVAEAEALTASEIVITDGSADLASAAVATYPSLAELAHVKGVTSAVQTQLDAKGAGDALTTNGLDQFAATTSLELKGVLADETGSGAAVFATSPTLVTPALGTPASGVATNLTGTAAGLTAGNVTTNANLTGEITSVGNAAVVDPSAITGQTTAGAFASGDKFLIVSGGALEQADFDDLPGAGGGIANVVEDTTPQLGGDLDGNAFDINLDASNMISFDTGTQAQKIVGDAGGITHTVPTGDTHDIVVNATTTLSVTETAAAVTGNITVSGTVDGRDVAADGTKLDGISAFGETLVDDADAATARTTLGVDAAGTDNSTDVTLAGTPDYITLAGQVLTRNQIDLTADVTGVLPSANLDADTMHLGVAQAITADKTFNDNVNATFGTGGDADIDYDGTDLKINPQVVGSGNVDITAGNLDVLSGTVQEAGVDISPIGVHDIWIGATAMWPSTTGGCADLAKTELATDQDIQTLDFDGASIEAAQFEVGLIKNWNAGTITATFYWSSTAADTDDVDWRISGVTIGDNVLLTTAYGSAITVTDAHNGAASELNISAATAAITLAGAAKSEMGRFLIERVGSSDTMTEDARLHGVMLHITTDAATAV